MKAARLRSSCSGSVSSLPRAKATIWAARLALSFCLARGAFHVDVEAGLGLLEADELERDDVGALVQELVEGMLAVGAGLAEDDRAGGVGQTLVARGSRTCRCSPCPTAAGGRGSAAGPGCRAGRRWRDTGGSCAPRRRSGRPSGRRSLGCSGCSASLSASWAPGQDLREHLRAKGQGKERSAHRARGGVAAADEIVDEERGQVLARFGQRAGLAGHGDDVLVCVWP